MYIYIHTSGGIYIYIYNIYIYIYIFDISSFIFLCTMSDGGCKGRRQTRMNVLRNIDRGRGGEGGEGGEGRVGCESVPLNQILIFL